MPELQDLLSDYKNEIDRLNPENVLFITTLRHRISEQLNKALLENEFPQGQLKDILNDIHKYDECLKENIDKYDKYLKEKQQTDTGALKELLKKELNEFEKWRKIIDPPKENWWWFFDEKHLPIHRRLDQPAQLMSIFCLSISIAFFIGLANRLGNNFFDQWLALFSVGLSLAFVLLGGSSIFTNAGRNLMKIPLGWLHVNEKYLDEFIACITIFICLISMLCFILIPNAVSDKIINNTNNIYESAPFKAIKNYQTAIRIKPEKSQPYHKLGEIYKELGEVDNAFKYYKIAYKNCTKKTKKGITKKLEECQLDVAKSIISLGVGLRIEHFSEKKINILKFGYKKIEKIKLPETAKNIDLLSASNEIVQVYLMEKNYSKADQWLKESMENSDAVINSQVNESAVGIAQYLKGIMEERNHINSAMETIPKQEAEDLARSLPWNEDIQIKKLTDTATRIEDLARAYLFRLESGNDHRKLSNNSNAYRWLSAGLTITDNDYCKQDGPLSNKDKIKLCMKRVSIARLISWLELNRSQSSDNVSKAALDYLNEAKDILSKREGTTDNEHVHSKYRIQVICQEAEIKGQTSNWQDCLNEIHVFIPKDWSTKNWKDWTPEIWTWRHRAISEGATFKDDVESVEITASSY